MHAETRKQHAQALEIGIVASPSRAAASRLVEAAHPLRRPARWTTSVALEREPEHLQVGDVEPPPELGRANAELTRRRRVAADAATYPSWKASQP